MTMTSTLPPTGIEPMDVPLDFTVMTASTESAPWCRNSFWKTSALNEVMPVFLVIRVVRWRR